MPRGWLPRPSFRHHLSANGMSRNALFIRPATKADFEQCQAIDHSYQTSHVWQMDYSEKGHLTTVRFQPVRLPRVLRISYPYSTGQLVAFWYEASCFLVGEKNNQICAYVTLRVDEAKSTAWISDLAIVPQERRQGYGSELLATASYWARNNNLVQLQAAMQTKNYPAIRFYQKNGFFFCGYHESWYQSGDIALFFCTRL